MSTYYENDRRRTSTRDRRRESDYYDDEVYTNTRDNQRSTTTALVRRRDDSPESVEEVRRDFSPGGGGYYRETITRKSGIRPAGRARSYDNDRYDDRSSYASTRRDSYRRDDDRRSRTDRRSKYSSSSSRSRTPPKKRERRKSMPEEALEALGLTGVVAALTGKKNRDRSSSSDRRSRSRGGGSTRKRSKSRSREQLTQALKAAVLAGAGAAFGARNDPGGWQGEKGKRVLTAAITAGGANGLINQYKDPEKHKLRDTLGSAAAGLAADRLVNGPNSRPGSPDRRDGRDGRNRSRSRGRDLLAGGAIAATAKKISDGFSRSRSRGRGSRSPSYDSYMDGSPPRRRSRSRSVVAGALSKVGLNSAADRVDPAGARDRDRSRSRSRSRSRRPSSRRRSRSRSGYVDDDDVYYDDPRRGSSVYDDPRRQSSAYVPPGNNYDSRGSIYGDNREFRR